MSFKSWKINTQVCSLHACRAEFPEAKIDVARLDLSDLNSVRSYGKLAQDQGEPLDVLLNNAGTILTSL